MESSRSPTQASLGRPRKHAASWPAIPEIEPREPRNLLVLATHQVVYCVGWIFKTESVVMPRFLDVVAGPGAGWLRGLMPVLGRFGQSVPQVFLAGRLRAMPRKAPALATFASLMAVPLLGMAGAWYTMGNQHSRWLPALVMGLYLLFFVFNGLYLLSFGTVQGKLIRPTHRGRLLRLATFWGTLVATVFVAWLLPGWLRTDGPVGPRFHAIFAWVAVCLGLSSLVALFLREPPDRDGGRARHRRRNLSDLVRALRADANLRRLGLTAMLLGSGLIVAPHYQAAALIKLNLPPENVSEHLMYFVVTQNAAVGAFSLLVGPLADAWGNRLTLRLMIFGAAFAPALAAGMLSLPDGTAAGLTWLVFVPLGISPLLLPILNNYTLETCGPARHPRYLSTVNLCVAVPFLLSPAAGWAADAVGFRAVFMATAVLLLLGGAATFFLDEPRRGREPPAAELLA